VASVRHQPLPYDDASPTAEMAGDCRAVERALRLPLRAAPTERAVRALARPAPSLRFEDYPHDVPKGSLTISAAASRLAAAIHPYLD
jgi:hypothetical protein